MRRLAIIGFLILTVACFASACKSKPKILSAHDEVLVYELPYDLVYLRAFEALENVDGWEIEETEKETGTIRVRNTSYSRLDDADLRLVTVQVKRLGRGQTTVALAPESQRVIGGGDLLERISRYVSREL